MAEKIFYPNPMIAARLNPAKTELFKGFRFKVSRIEGSGAVLIENEPRFAEAAWHALLGSPFGLYFLLPWNGASARDICLGGDHPDPLLIQFIGILVIGCLFVGGIMLFATAVFGFVHSLFPRRILIQNETLRFEGMPLSRLVINMDQIDALYVVTRSWKGHSYCSVAFALRVRNRIRLLYAHWDPVFYPQVIRTEGEQIVAHRPLANLLKHIVGKPAKLQQYAQKKGKIRALWR